MEEDNNSVTHCEWKKIDSNWWVSVDIYLIGIITGQHVAANFWLPLLQCFRTELLKQKYTVVFLRHGESLWNKENRFTGWTDVRLSSGGNSSQMQGFSRPSQLVKHSGKMGIVSISATLRCSRGPFKLSIMLRTRWTATTFRSSRTGDWIRGTMGLCRGWTN